MARIDGNKKINRKNALRIQRIVHPNKAMPRFQKRAKRQFAKRDRSLGVVSVLVGALQFDLSPSLASLREGFDDPVGIFDTQRLDELFQKGEIGNRWWL